MAAIMVFSHLRWDFAFQRPQHIMARLADHYPILFIEEPQFHENRPSLETYAPIPNVLVCQPQLPVNALRGLNSNYLAHLRTLLDQLAQLRGASKQDERVIWFYTPMAFPLLRELQPRLVVYDCIDEPACCKNAPRQLLRRENELLKEADIVFADGQSLYRSKRARHPNVHYVPNSVDASHFEYALDRANSHPAHRRIPGPRLGYYGVIDERFDTELIGELADAHPQWQIVLVGPVVGIDPKMLPRRANIHYLGQQPYRALPQFLAGWDVCLLPYALNESTRFINPIETLEYMAAELPIVSTPVADVAERYGDIVAIADDVRSFIAACEEALLASPQVHAERVKKMRQITACTSWDAAAGKMRELLETTPRRHHDRLIADPETVASVGMPLRPVDGITVAPFAYR